MNAGFVKIKYYINSTGRTSVWYFRPWTRKILLITGEETLQIHSTNL